MKGLLFVAAKSRSPCINISGAKNTGQCYLFCALWRPHGGTVAVLVRSIPQKTGAGTSRLYPSFRCLSYIFILIYIILSYNITALLLLPSAPSPMTMGPEFGQRFSSPLHGHRLRHRPRCRSGPLRATLLPTFYYAALFLRYPSLLRL
jgi:hypothetical protein